MHGLQGAPSPWHMWSTEPKDKGACKERASAKRMTSLMANCLGLDCSRMLAFFFVPSASLMVVGNQSWSNVIGATAMFVGATSTTVGSVSSDASEQTLSQSVMSSMSLSKTIGDSPCTMEAVSHPAALLVHGVCDGPSVMQESCFSGGTTSAAVFLTARGFGGTCIGGAANACVGASRAARQAPWREPPEETPSPKHIAVRSSKSRLLNMSARVYTHGAVTTSSGDRPPTDEGGAKCCDPRPAGCVVGR
mmetsp:Transcript_12891/g.37139  ORF Transcript_12891/g.37139 Transcript_12891/m.37139 type:complete len:249 (+) Transcript_12891:273-1019(+)